MTIDGNLDVTGSGAYAAVVDGLTLNGTATLGNGNDLDFYGSQTLGGTATVVFQNGANALIANTTGMTLTLGPNVLVRGGGGYSGQIGYSSLWGGGGNTSIVNEGTISADTAGMEIDINPQGTGTLTNSGTLSIVGGTLILGGNFSLATLGTVTRSGGSVYLAGTLTNIGTTLTLNAAAGSWNLLGDLARGGG